MLLHHGAVCNGRFNSWKLKMLALCGMKLICAKILTLIYQAAYKERSEKGAKATAASLKLIFNAEAYAATASARYRSCHRGPKAQRQPSSCAEEAQAGKLVSKGRLTRLEQPLHGVGQLFGGLASKATTECQQIQHLTFPVERAIIETAAGGVCKFLKAWETVMAWVDSKRSKTALITLRR